MKTLLHCLFLIVACKLANTAIVKESINSINTNVNGVNNITIRDIAVNLTSEPAFKNLVKLLNLIGFGPKELVKKFTRAANTVRDAQVVDYPFLAIELFKIFIDTSSITRLRLLQIFRGFVRLAASESIPRFAAITTQFYIQRLFEFFRLNQSVLTRAKNVFRRKSRKQQQ